MKPSTPKGTRDFSPSEVIRRNYIFDTIRRVFVRYGFQPIETPAMENLSTLTGKYGEEGDQLLFKVLNNGDFLSKANADALTAKDSNKVLPQISKRGLRYDLTVPFARYVVQHQNDIAFPFKRYQIQPVWRADRPQKGRYQQFYQCDGDVVGTDSLLCEAELVQIYDQVFAELGIQVVIKINNRKVLEGLAETAGCADHFVDMVTAVDKLDKIGMGRVKEEMTKRGISAEAANRVEELLGTNDLDTLETAFANSEVGQSGIAELREFHRYFDQYTPTNKVEFDITLARGLSYYTGCVFEVAHSKEAYPEVVMGSIGGGGRYADLTGTFGMKDMSGVGISFGAARIFDVLTEIDGFPALMGEQLQVLLVAFDEETHLYAFGVLNQLRAAGINAELYPTPAKMKKQMKYADARGVPYTVVIGSREMESGELGMKEMATGEQVSLTVAGIIARLG